MMKLITAMELELPRMDRAQACRTPRAIESLCALAGHDMSLLSVSRIHRSSVDAMLLRASMPAAKTREDFGRLAITLHVLRQAIHGRRQGT